MYESKGIRITAWSLLEEETIISAAYVKVTK